MGGRQLFPVQAPPQGANSSKEVFPNLPHGIVGVGVGVVVDVVVGVGVAGHAALGWKAIQSPQSNTPNYKPSKIEFDNIYEMYVKDSGPRSINEILLDKDRNMIKDIKNGWELSTSELKIKYIRDKKIGNILD